MTHYTEEDLTLYHYGEARRPDRIEGHLQTCASCAAIHDEIARTLGMAGQIPVPDRDERYGLEVWQRIRHDLPPQAEPWWMPWYRPALVASLAVMVLAAFAAGRYSTASPRTDSGEADSIAELRLELRAMRQMLALSLMQQQSATERLRGVSGSAQIDQPGAEIVRALLDTLLHDSNVNVRLAAVDALRRFSMQDAVRQGTLEALNQSAFPLVQIALIDYMVETKATQAVGALRRLSEDTQANSAVRSRAAWGLQQLGS
jgi:hypothetical protein